MESAMKNMVLEDLLRINKECSKTLQELMNHEPLLSSFFQHLVDVERDCRLQLRQHVVRSHGDPADKVERKGEIYKAWMEWNHSVPVKEKEASSICEKKLYDLVNAYNEAIQKGAELSDQVVNMLQGQIDRVKNGFQLLLRRSTELNQAKKAMIV